VDAAIHSFLLSSPISSRLSIVEKAVILQLLEALDDLAITPVGKPVTIEICSVTEHACLARLPGLARGAQI